MLTSFSAVLESDENGKCGKIDGDIGLLFSLANTRQKCSENCRSHGQSMVVHGGCEEDCVAGC